MPLLAPGTVRTLSVFAATDARITPFTYHTPQFALDDLKRRLMNPRWQGEELFDGIDLRALGYRTIEHVATERATHIVLAR